MQIISASRRTDLPAFYSDWFMHRVRAGQVTYRNPFGGKRYQVSLRPDDVHSIVFWSKDFRPLLPHLSELDGRGFRFYCHFTITGLPREFEPAVRPSSSAVESFRLLAHRYSPAHVQWRYDPIVISRATDYIYHICSYKRLCRALRGHTHRCYVSFVQMYRKTERSLLALPSAVRPLVPTQKQQQWLVQQLSRLAHDSGITLYACCADYLVGDRVLKASCVDGRLLAELFPDRPLLHSLRPTRPGCGCIASRDIGAYDTCSHGCVYCYANASQEMAGRRLSKVDLMAEELGAVGCS